MNEDTRKCYDQAIRFYIQNLENFNQIDFKGRNESIKWTSLVSFKENWDIESTDLLASWKKATKRSFIDTGYSAPTNGIAKLLEMPEEVEGVREAFRMLFSDDEGDLQARENRIWKFNDSINARIKDHFPNTKLYLQKFDTTLTYLNLYDPDHNYRYKATPARKWAAHIGYSDFQTGAYFKLAKYYRMCDELLEVIKEEPEVIQRHQELIKRLNCTDYDKALHVLTFDVLFCMWSNEDQLTEIREQEQKREDEEQKQQLLDEMAQIQNEIQDLQSQVETIEVIGCTVRNKKYGLGKVSHIENGRAEVIFDIGMKKFPYPSSIEEGHLTLTDPDMISRFARNQEIRAQVKDLETVLREISARLEQY